MKTIILVLLFLFSQYLIFCQPKLDSITLFNNYYNNKQDIYFEYRQIKEIEKYKLKLIINSNDTIYLHNENVIKIDKVLSGKLIILENNKKKLKEKIILYNIEEYIFGQLVIIKFSKDKLVIGNKCKLDLYNSSPIYKLGSGIGSYKIEILNITECKKDKN